MKNPVALCAVPLAACLPAPLLAQDKTGTEVKSAESKAAEAKSPEAGFQAPAAGAPATAPAPAAPPGLRPFRSGRTGTVFMRLAAGDG